MTDGESSDGRYMYRTPFYQKLKQLNTDIFTFKQQVRGVKFSPRRTPRIIPPTISSDHDLSSE